MRHLLTALLAFGMFAGVLAGRSIAADAPDGPPPNGGQDNGPGSRQGGGPGGPPGGVHLIPPFVREKLDLTDDQKKQIADLEQDVKAKLAKILTPEQMKTLEETRPPRRPGGQGGGQGGGGQGGHGQGGSPGQDPNENSGERPPRPQRPNNEINARDSAPTPTPRAERTRAAPHSQSALKNPWRREYALAPA